MLIDTLQSRRLGPAIVFDSAFDGGQSVGIRFRPPVPRPFEPYQAVTVNFSFGLRHPSSMEKLQRRFGADIGAWLRKAVAEEGCTRGSLACGLCKAADWRNATGKLCLASARSALPAFGGVVCQKFCKCAPACQKPVLPPDRRPGTASLKGACKHIVGNRFKRTGCRWSKAGVNDLLAIGCCLENMRWPDFLDWRACRAAAACPNNGMHPARIQLLNPAINLCYHHFVCNINKHSV